MSCALFLLTRITGVGSCIMLSPTRTREMLSRRRPNGFRVWPNSPIRECGRHVICPRTLLSRTDSGVVRQPHHVASHSTFHDRVFSVAFSSVKLKLLSMNTPRHSTVSLKVMIQVGCARHIMCPRSTPFPSRGVVRQPHHVASHSSIPGLYSTSRNHSRHHGRFSFPEVIPSRNLMSAQLG